LRPAAPAYATNGGDPPTTRILGVPPTSSIRPSDGRKPETHPSARKGGGFAKAGYRATSGSIAISAAAFSAP
jgi:hypothetical protein